MDIEQIVGNLGKLMKFKAEVEAFMTKVQSAGAPSFSPDDIGKILSFIPDFDRALADFGKLASDIKSVSEHVTEIRQDLAPVIEWVEAKQRAEAEAAEKADAEARELAQQQADEAAKPPPAEAAAIDKPADQPPA